MGPEGRVAGEADRAGSSRALILVFILRAVGNRERVKSSNLKSSEDDAGCLVEMD